LKHNTHKGPLRLSGGYTHVLVVVCALTRFTLYIPVRTTTGEETMNALITHVFSIFGYPLVIVSDNGSSFANKLTRAFQSLFGYRWIFVMPHTPQANGLAEAAVKKLKIMLDRHTKEYTGWNLLLPMIQAAVNTRAPKTTKYSPFSMLFGRQPVTLAALEQPHLLPETNAEEYQVKELAGRMSRLHRRLQTESDLVKKAMASLDKHKPPKRQVQEGDRIWLTYSDSERSRYLRKHGHGQPWRHAFRVLEVKPHAVRLEIPKDGSVPEVLPWQSLRKCSFAPPAFHDELMPLPDVNEYGLPLMPVAEVAPAPAQPPLPNIEDIDDNGWSTYHQDPSRTYEIERIVSARRKGGGWSLMVKWVGYPTPTPEPLSAILSQTNNPEILREIERCKADYIACNPGEAVTESTSGSEPEVLPTRVLPTRMRSRTDRLMFQVYGAVDCRAEYRRLARGLQYQSLAQSFFMVDQLSN
jgi:hypothetical protein